MSRLVIAIPTYNSSAIVDETLSIECEYWRQHDVDIYLYDSSTDKDTHKVYKKWIDKGYDNIYYAKIDSDVHSNKKVYMLYQQLSKNNKYDFIWMRRDYTSYVQKTCNLLINSLADDIAIISIRKTDGAVAKPVSYVDREEYMKNHILNATIYGDCVLNARVMLRNIDWKYFEKKYIQSKAVNFSHVGLYYELLAQKRCLGMCTLGVDGSGYNDSKLKKGSFWISDLMGIFVTGWGELLEKLSQYYSSVYDVADLSGRCFMSELLIRYRNEEKLNLKSLWLNRKWSKRVIGKNYKLALKLAITPRKKIYRIVNQHNEDNDKALRRFVAGCSQIYIYGARKYGKIVLDLIDDRDKAIAFVKTKLDENDTTFEGKTLISLEQLKSVITKNSTRKENVGVVVAVSEPVRPEIVALLDNSGIRDNVFVNKTIINIET